MKAKWWITLLIFVCCLAAVFGTFGEKAPSRSSGNTDTLEDAGENAEASAPIEEEEEDDLLLDLPEEIDEEQAEASDALEEEEQTQFDESELFLEAVPNLLLESTETVVTTFADLRTALQENNGITTVYLGADITGLASGIVINNQKTSVTICGLDPTNPDQTVPYTYTEYASSFSTDAIRIESANAVTKSISVRDLNIVGKNYYGTVSVYDNATTAGVVQAFERVTYSGPQLFYNRQNTVQITDCQISITGANGGSGAQEFGEARQFLFAGTNTIHTIDTANSIFYFPYSGSNVFRLLDGASLTCTRASTSALYLSMYSLYTVDMQIGTGASLVFNTPNGLLSSSEFTSFSMGTGSNFALNLSGTPAVALIPMAGPLTIGAHSTFAITGYGSAAGAYLAQNGGDIVLEEFAALTIDSYSTGSVFTQSAGNLTIGEDASFTLNARVSTGDVAFKRTAGMLTVAENGSFSITGASASSYALMAQATGSITVGENAVFKVIANTAHTYLLQLNGSALNIQNPASVVFYNGNHTLSSVTNAGSIAWNAQQINYWNAVSPGGLDNRPLYGWHKADTSTNLTVSGTISTGDSGNIGTVTTNYESGDSPIDVPPSSATLNMVNARVIALGRLSLHVNTPTLLATQIHGNTTPGASVRVTLIQGDVSTVLDDVTADTAGTFYVPLPAGFVPNTNTIAYTQAADPYLYAEASVPFEATGSLQVAIPDSLHFLTEKLPAVDTLIGRVDSSWQIEASDTRGSGGQWSLYARVVKPLTPETADRPALSDAIVLVDGDAVTPIPTDQPMEIYLHETLLDDELITISWDADQGILAEIPGGVVYNERYTGAIEWTIVDAP